MGKGNNVPSNEPAVISDLQTPLSADKRQQDIEEYAGYIQGDLDRMHDIVANMVASSHDTHPITVVSSLLAFWLENANPNLEVDSCRGRMKGALRLIDEINELHSVSESIFYYRDELADAKKGEVRGE